MSQLSITLLRLGFLVLLWALVLSAIGVLRADIYGTRVLARGRGLTARRKTAADTPPTRSSTGVARHREWSLAVVAGPLKGTVIPLGSSTVSIGRAPTATLVLEDDYCSSRHARVYLDDGQWMLEDLGSTNGTYLGDARVEEPVPLEPGDMIRLGATAIEMRD